MMKFSQGRFCLEAKDFVIVIDHTYYKKRVNQEKWILFAEIFKIVNMLTIASKFIFSVVIVEKNHLVN